MDTLKYLSDCSDFEILKNAFTQEGLEYCDSIIKERQEFLNKYYSENEDCNHDDCLGAYEDACENSSSYVVDWYVGSCCTEEFLEAMADCYPEFMKSR